MTNVPIVPPSKQLKPVNSDPAMRLVADSGLKFQRPWLSAGGLKFTWPVGTEGFRVSGTATMGVHKYIGDNTAKGNVIHFNEGHIEMTGTLPGLTSPLNMVKLEDVLMSRNKKILSLPGILPRLQYVLVENYDFTHAQDDRLSLIDYTISFLRVGVVGGSQTSPSAQGTTRSGSSGKKSKSKSPRVYTTTQTVNTFRLVADKVYGNVNQWTKLVDLNQKKLIDNNPALKNVPSYSVPYYRWPLGTKIAY